MSQQQALSTVKLILEAYEMIIALYVALNKETYPETMAIYRADIANIRSRLDVLNDVLEDIIEWQTAT